MKHDLHRYLNDRDPFELHVADEAEGGAPLNPYGWREAFEDGRKVCGSCGEAEGNEEGGRRTCCGEPVVSRPVALLKAEGGKA